MKELCFNKIKPFIRFAHIFDIHSNGQFTNIRSYDYRFFYCYKGKGKIYLDNKEYTLRAGSLIVWQPALTYSIGIIDDEFKIIGINFDFTYNNSDKSAPIPPNIVEKFSQSEVIEIVRFLDVEILNNPIFIESIDLVENKLLEIINEYKNKKILFDSIVSGLFTDIISQIVRVKLTGRSDSKNNIDLILSYIHKNYNKQISNKLLGDTFNYHPNYLNQLMHIHTGMSLHQYILNYRLKKAIILIQTTNLSIYEICTSVGFNDFTHFSKYFKKKIGKSPSDFK